MRTNVKIILGIISALIMLCIYLAVDNSLKGDLVGLVLNLVVILYDLTIVLKPFNLKRELLSQDFDKIHKSDIHSQEFVDFISKLEKCLVYYKPESLSLELLEKVSHLDEESILNFFRKIKKY